MALLAQPFELHVEDSALGDLRDRLDRARLPDEAPVAPWSFGTSVDFMRELIAYCKEHLADVKCPRSVDFRPELPRHPTGKLYKRLLKDEYWAAAGRSI